uniref:Uncharacterized protein n=1 Tax=Mycena chlorophos TaxID=658473 RepID=A0ABQ0L1Q0_MYCCL|nr:predicted protein [Mycena chlorophos]
MAKKLNPKCELQRLLRRSKAKSTSMMKEKEKNRAQHESDIKFAHIQSKINAASNSEARSSLTAQRAESP